MLKNLDKVGLGFDTEGKIQIVPKVQNPKLDLTLNSCVGKVLTHGGSISELKEQSTEKSKEVKVTRKKYTTVSSTTDAAFGGNITATNVMPTTYYQGVLEGILGKNDWETKHKIYRDIYTYDLSGALVDLIATLPFSDFNLTGITDDKVLQVYMDTISDLRLPEMLPAITTDYLVMGSFVGSLGWDSTKNKFTAMIPQDIDFCEIYDLGISGVDPVIDVTLPPRFQQILGMHGSRFDRMKQQLPDYIVQGANSNGKIELDPFYTMFVPRNGITSSFTRDEQADTKQCGTGSSYFNRILTIFLLEKALIKGTIESAQRRQRAITHIVAGTDDWLPNDQELSDLANLFQAADLDPISAQVVTRSGVEVNSVKSGDDFWKWNDIFDFTSGAKLKALGVNESILSGDASFNTLDASLSTFMDSIERTRDIITNLVFYNKICPIIAYHNDFKKKDTSSKLSVLSTLKSYKNNKYVGHVGKFSTFAASNSPEIEDFSQYEIPQLQYTKSLKPEADRDYLEILSTLEEKGVPIPLRIYAAAGGENIDELIETLDDDNELRAEIAEKKKDLIDDAVKAKVERFLGFENIDELLPPEENSDNEFEARVKAFTGASMSNIDRTRKARNLQDHEELYGVREYDSSGHRRVLTANRKQQITDKIHKQTAEVLASKAQQYNSQLKENNNDR